MEWNGLTVDDLKSSFSKIADWLEGKHSPTMKQLESFAAKTHTIVPYFFMESAPQIRLQIADFRTVANTSASKAPSPELFETIDSMLYRQGWMSDYFQAEGYEALPYIGIFASQEESVDSNHIADYLHGLLSLDLDWASGHGIHSTDDAWRTLRKAIEKTRVSVSISGHAGSNQGRKFSVEEFRGFVLSDRFAPIVFVNGGDAKAAQMFTLIHEYTHLLFARTGLDNYEDDPALFLTSGQEHFCDKVAAEFLVPTSRFMEVWESGKDHDRALGAAVAKFKASYIVCLRKALELGLIAQEDFWLLYNDHKKAYQEAPKRTKGKNDKWDPYPAKGTQLGDVFSDAVFMAVKDEYLPYSEAYKITGLKSQSFDRYYSKRGLVV